MRAAPLLLWSALLPAQDPQIPPATLRPLERVAVELKKASMQTELDQLLEFLRDCDYPDRARQGLDRRLQRTRPSNRPIRYAQLASQVEKVAGRIAELLAEQAEPDRERLARRVLLLDDDNQAAREALGHQRIAGLWLSPEDRDLKKNRAAIVDAVRRARVLAPAIDTDKSANPLLAAVVSKRAESDYLPAVPIHRAHYRGVTVHVLGSDDRAARILANAFRTAALVQWMLDGKLEPPAPKARELVVFGSRDAYRQAIDLSIEQGKIAEDDGKAWRYFHGYDDPRGFEVMWFYREEEASAWIVRGLFGDYKHFPPLWEGILNWATTEILHTWMPRTLDVVFDITQLGDLQIEIIFESGEVSPWVYYEGRRADEHTRYAWAGREGRHHWLRYLLRQGRQRAWSDSFGQPPAKIAGNRLLTCTTMAEFLLERGELRPILDKLPGARIDDKEIRQKVEEALGNLGDLDRAMHHWLQPLPFSLADALRSAEAEIADDDLAAFVTALHGLRKQAVHRRPDVSRWEAAWSRHLAHNARAHAIYLAAHPEASLAQDPTHADYTPQGDRTAMHAVFARDADRPEAALTDMMARLPDRLWLLDPSLLAFGAAQHEGVLVVDCRSVVEPSFSEWRIRWPVRDQTDVPTRYGSGPSPIEGVAASELGYPITVQTGQRQRGPTLRLQLRLFEVGRRELEPVECYEISPEGGPAARPGLIEPRTFILVPKTRLKPRTTYEVQALLPEDREDMTWRFTTGR